MYVLHTKLTSVVHFWVSMCTFRPKLQVKPRRYWWNGSRRRTLWCNVWEQIICWNCTSHVSYLGVSLLINSHVNILLQKWAHSSQNTSNLEVRPQWISQGSITMSGSSISTYYWMLLSISASLSEEAAAASAMEYKMQEWLLTNANLVTRH